MTRILLFLLFPLFCTAKQKICLNMIVKNESRVITRCLDSVIPLIDYWVIVDTGSDDGTQAIIKKHLKNIPGELHERPWRNFGENRSEAFNLARGKGDYILFMDADDTLEFEGKRTLPLLTHDLYHMWRGVKGFSYLKPQIAKGNISWKWVGVTHEYLDCGHAYTSSTLPHVKYMSGDGGASTYDPQKFLKNVALLTEGLKKEPDNARYAFYLAESYRDAGDPAKALECFQKRAIMGGWEEEVFWSKFQIAQMLLSLKMPTSLVIEAYKLAHQYRPHRSDSIYFLCDVYHQENRYEESYRLLKSQAALSKPAHKDTLFNQDWIDDYGLLFQLSICAYYLGHFKESLDACDQLLAMKDLPKDIRAQTEKNRVFPANKLKNGPPQSEKSIFAIELKD